MRAYVDVTLNSSEFESVPMIGTFLHGYELSDGAYAAHALYGDTPAFEQYESAIVACANERGTGCAINGHKFTMVFRPVADDYTGD